MAYPVTACGGQFPGGGIISHILPPAAAPGISHSLQKLQYAAPGRQPYAVWSDRTLCRNLFVVFLAAGKDVQFQLFAYFCRHRLWIYPLGAGRFSGSLF